MHGSWSFCQTKRVWIVFCNLRSCPNSMKQLQTCDLPKVSQKFFQKHWLVQSHQNGYRFWTSQSQQNDQFENLHISSHEEARNIKFGWQEQVNLVLRISMGTPTQEEVTSLLHNHVTLTNFFISIYKGANVIKFW